MRRRRFLARLAQASLYATVASCSDECQDDAASSGDEGADGEEILVIGAGMSGLAAARGLALRGLRVTVLEARDRLGGRTFTDRSRPDAPLDLGASWIHGADGNPLTELAAELGAKTAPTDYDDQTIYGPDGDELGDPEQEAIDARFEQLVAALCELAEERLAAGQPDLSLRDAIDQVLAAGTLGALTEAQLRELEYSINTTVEHEEAADASDISLFHGFEDIGEDPGGEGEGVGVGGDLLVASGYDTIVGGLAQGLTIRLSHVVKAIAIDDDGVVVTTDRGTFEADRVVVTVPLGVLKAGAVAFTPPLPARKSAAIERLGFSVLTKVYLRFTEAFWDDHQVLGYVAAQRGRWGETYNVQRIAGEAALLLFNAGSYGLAVEAKSDQDVVAEAMGVLRTIYGDDVPAPEAHLISRWGADPFARGSYSHVRPGASGDDFDALAEPVGDRLFFAGEATESGNWGTVHGAYLSGLREVERIAALAGAPLAGPDAARRVAPARRGLRGLVRRAKRRR
jgi:monoamine oxidase